MIVRTLCRIEPGTELTINYVVPVDAYARVRRQLERYGFNCDCMRCRLFATQRRLARSEERLYLASHALLGRLATMSDCDGAAALVTLVDQCDKDMRINLDNDDDDDDNNDDDDEDECDVTKRREARHSVLVQFRAQPDSLQFACE